jgi:hypothetical protein
MLKQIARKLAAGATLLALVTPAALASTPLGTDPEPGVVHTILTFFGLAWNIFAKAVFTITVADSMAKVVFTADVPADLIGRGSRSRSHTRWPAWRAPPARTWMQSFWSKGSLFGAACWANFS